MYVTGRAVHAFRHTFATETLKNNNIRVTQEALYHKDITTTQIDTHIVAEQKRRFGKISFFEEYQKKCDYFLEPQSHGLFTTIALRFKI